MPISFATTTGKVHDPVTVNATSLTAATKYVAVLTSADGQTQRVEFTTDGAGAASFTFAVCRRGAYMITASPAVTSPAVTGSNTFTGV